MSLSSLFSLYNILSVLNEIILNLPCYKLITVEFRWVMESWCVSQSNICCLGVNPACQLGRGNILTVFWGKVSSKHEQK